MIAVKENSMNSRNHVETWTSREAFEMYKILHGLWARDELSQLFGLLEEWKQQEHANIPLMMKDLDFLYWNAVASFENQKIDLALNQIDKAIGILNDITTNSGKKELASYYLAKFYLLEATIYLSLNQPESARKVIIRVLEPINALEKPFLLSEGLLLLSQAEIDLREHEKAHQHLLQALTLVETRTEPIFLKIRGLINRNLGIIYRFKRDSSKAIHYLTRALQIFKTLKNHRQSGLTLIELARTYLYMKEHEKSLQHYQQAELHFREIKDSQNLVLVLSDQARIHSMLRRLDVAAQKLREASKYLAESAGPLQEWKNHMFTGLTSFRQENITQAIYHFKEAASMAHKLKHKIKEAHAQYNLARMLFYCGDYQQAKKIAEQSLRVFLEEENSVSPALLVSSYLLLGNIFFEGFSMYITSRYYLEKALVQARLLENLEDQVRAQLDLIKIDIATMNLDVANRQLEHLKNLLSQHPSGVMSEFHHVEGLYLDALEHHDQALGKYKLALKCFVYNSNPHLQMTILYHVGRCLNHIQHHETALEYLNEAILIARNLKNHAHQARIHEEMAKAWEALDSIEEAIEHWEAALRSYSRYENEIDKLLSIYIKLVDFHEQLGNHQKMNALVEEAELLLSRVRHQLS